MSYRKLDEIDLTLLRVLQTRGRITRKDLAAIVELSIPAVSDRIRKLEQDEIIKGYTATLNKDLMGLTANAFIFLKVESGKYKEVIERSLQEPNILECHAITGNATHLMKVCCRNNMELEELLATIQSWGGMQSTLTHIVLSSPKETLQLHIP